MNASVPKPLVFALWGAFLLLSLALSLHELHLSDRTRGLFLVSVVAFAGIMAASLLRRGDASCGHDHGEPTGWAAFGIQAIPLTLVLCLGRTTLPIDASPPSFAPVPREPAPRAVPEAVPSQVPPAAPEVAEPVPPPTSPPANRASSIFITIPPEDRVVTLPASLMPADAGPVYIPFKLNELIVPDLVRGHEHVEVIAQARGPQPGIEDDGELGYWTARLTITCCAADARPFWLLVEAAKPDAGPVIKPPKDAWLRLRGRLVATAIDQPIRLVETTWTTIPAPASPYLQPLDRR